MRTVFDCAIQPIAKQRPKVGHGRGYTPKRTVKFEKDVRDAYLALALPKHEGTVALELVLGKKGFTVYLDSGSFDERILRGDLDNYAKSILDALNGVAYEDDGQIQDLWVYEG